jgi:hypothetical protein
VWESASGRKAAAICFLVGSLLSRFAWIWAGQASAKDPEAAVSDSTQGVNVRQCVCSEGPILKIRRLLPDIRGRRDKRVESFLLRFAGPTSGLLLFLRSSENRAVALN